MLADGVPPSNVWSLPTGKRGLKFSRKREIARLLQSGENSQAYSKKTMSSFLLLLPAVIYNISRYSNADIKGSVKLQIFLKLLRDIFEQDYTVFLKTIDTEGMENGWKKVLIKA